MGVVHRVRDTGWGFLSAEGFATNIFFHSNSLRGVKFDELTEGDTLTFETEVITRKRPSSDTVKDGRLLMSYDEQKIATPSSPADIKLQKKVTAEFIARLSQKPTDLYRLSASEFEELIAELYVIDGYTVELLGSWNQADGGVDLLAMKCDIGSHQLRMAIQCKRYARSNLVSAEPIRSLAGVLDRFHAHAGALVTTSDFTKPARREAESFFWKVSLMNYESIVEMLRRAELLVKPPLAFPPDRTPAEITVFYLNAVNIDRV